MALKDQIAQLEHVSEDLFQRVQGLEESVKVLVSDLDSLKEQMDSINAKFTKLLEPFNSAKLNINQSNQSDESGDFYQAKRKRLNAIQTQISNLKRK